MEKAGPGPRSPCSSAVVKLGGGLITFKSRPYTIDRAMLESAASQIAAYSRGVGRLAALVHGGGSYGHAAVAEAEARGGLTLEAAPRVQQAMLRLAMEVVASLARHGVEVSVHPPHTFCYGGGCILEPLRRDYILGLTPMTFGDAVPVEGGVEIVSGDDLAAQLAVELGVECLIYATRVPGVMSGGRVVPSIRSVGEFEDLGSGDATGGMARKVRAALEASRRGVSRVVIVGGDRLLDALKGVNVGTRVEAR
ncbi:isopentenyl phosphate kinase family protein [Aeropyrum camini]|uniref:Isopentenyl phosphate kinase n=1 Tax=Aeropyrum camini SY1 = JCM 12091 TaxID=1198449 RepID=U3TF30_9CREN|nr:isopentenyl phosphate kinase [Aeropyrum camini]BAN90578.1 isopentenyl phosphate kinase [Aeropyrum camini SY1 = JCM 12091]